MGEWRLSNLLKQESRVVRLQSEQSYKLLGVKWYGQGVFLREEKKGSEIKAEKLYQVKAGDFIYNRLFAWKSSFAIVPAELDGCLVSNEFPVFTAVDGRLDLQFLLRYILLPHNIDTVNRVSGGMSSVSRKRFKEEDFLRLSVPAISPQEQQQLCQVVSRRESILDSLESEKDQQLSLLKQLRQAVLQEAVEGKLTADLRRQHPVVKNDPQYDAAALLAQIKAEKERLVKAGKIRKEKPLPPIAESDKPFELPAGWVWCRLGDVAQSISTGPFGSMLHKSDYVSNGIPLVNPMNMVSNRIIPSGKMMVSKETSKRLERYSLDSGDIVVARRGDLSKCAIVEAENEGWLCGTGSFFLKLCQINNYFFIKIFVSKYAQSYLLRDSIGQTMDNLNQGLLAKMPFPLPPLAEQQAIVARVDSLMAIIDELEKQVAERKEQAQMLMQTVLREAFAGEEAVDDDACIGARHASPLRKLASVGNVGADCVRPARMQCAPTETLPLVADTPAGYKAGGQAVLPAANQPVPGGIPARILAAMQPGREYSRADLLAATSITEADWIWAIRQLKEQRKVVQMGERRGARYVLERAVVLN